MATSAYVCNKCGKAFEVENVCGKTFAAKSNETDMREKCPRCGQLDTVKCYTSFPEGPDGSGPTLTLR